MDVQAELAKFKPGSKEQLLLEKVLDRLGPDFARKTLLEKAKEASQKREEAMQKHFENKIVQDAVDEVINQQELEMPLSNNAHHFHLEQLRKYLPEDDSFEPSKLCGLTQEDIPKATELQSASFRKLVSEKLKEFFIDIIKNTGGTFDEHNWRKSFNLTVKNMKSKIDSYAHSKNDVMESRKELKNQIQLYYEELGKSLMLLNKLLELYQEKLDFESSVSQLYMLHCYALSQKTELFHMKLTLATYNIKTLPILKQISSELNQKEETLKEEEQKFSEMLVRYSQLGEEYEAIVNEILDLTKKIEEEQHAIDHLKSLMPERSVSASDEGIL